MKKNSFTLFFILTFSMLSVLAKDGIGMLRQGIFNEGWKFNLDDDAAFKNPTFDDSGWRNVTLPHDWMIETEMKENNPSDQWVRFCREVWDGTERRSNLAIH